MTSAARKITDTQTLGKYVECHIFIVVSLASDVFDNTNGMSNIRRLGQGLWLVKNVNFTSGRRPCCQKRHLLKGDLQSDLRMCTKEPTFYDTLIQTV
jgi:hypothetical protein